MTLDRDAVKVIVHESLPCSTGKECIEVKELKYKMSKLEETLDSHTKLLVILLITAIGSLVAALAG